MVKDLVINNSLVKCPKHNNKPHNVFSHFPKTLFCNYKCKYFRGFSNNMNYIKCSYNSLLEKLDKLEEILDE